MNFDLWRGRNPNKFCIKCPKIYRKGNHLFQIYKICAKFVILLFLQRAMFLTNGTFGFTDAWTILSFTYTIFVVIMVGVVIAERREPVKSLAWIMVITMFPVGGMILFLAFGRNHRKQRTFMQKELFDNKLISKMCGEQLKELPACDEIALADRSHIILMLNNSRSILTINNRVEILKNGDNCFPKMFADLAQAKEFIHIEFFGLESGHLFEDSFEVLRERVASGVEVRVIYDGVGGRALARRDVRRMKEVGIDVRCFMPVLFTRFPSLINYRNHRKIVVIDGKVGYTGGMNIADRYVDGIKGRGIWRDTHLRIEGEAVAMLQTVFVTDWAFVTDGQTLDAPRFFPPSEVPNICPLQIATSGPDSPYASIKHSYFAAITKAQKYVYISTPYLLPDNAILTALRVAALSGVDVRVLIPVRGDNIIVSWASYSYVDTLMESGVKVFLYRKGFNHSKFIVIDDELCTVGSANLDYRSFEDDFEVQAIIYDNPTTRQLRDVFFEDLNDAEEITPEMWAERSRLSKIMEPIAKLLSPLF